VTVLDVVLEPSGPKQAVILSPKRGRCGGLVALETGGGEQPRLVAAMLRVGGAFVHVRVVNDLAGIPRHVVGTRSDRAA
jgi:methylase of polypeptide subunit release factors